MGDNIIHITDLGLQAANNAKAGGLLVNLVTFKIGDGDQTHNDADINISGNLIYQGTINFVEVKSKNSVRFTFDLPAYAVPVGGAIGREVAFFLDDNVMFGRCVFDEPYSFVEGETYRINALLVTTRCDLSVINVSLGDFLSIPSTPGVHTLPNPTDSDFNAISVLDLFNNSDGTISSGVALRYGAGALQWAFSGHDRIYSGIPDAGATNTEFKATALTSSVTFLNGEVVVVYVVSGPAAGQTRKFYYNAGDNKFIEYSGNPFINFDTQSTMVVWRKLAGSLGGNNYPPSMVGIPNDWVLTRGVSNLPVWAPPKTGAKVLSTLYQAPGRLRLTVRNEIGSGQISRYSLGGTIIRDNNHCMTAIGGITQHKSAFDINSGEIEYGGKVPANAPIDIRLITKEPGNGTYIDIITDKFISDGATVRFPITSPIEASHYCFVYIRGVLQATSSYGYDIDNQEIVFNTTIPEGLDIEISSLVPSVRENYSTQLLSTTVITVGPTLFVELPIAPQSADFTFVSVSGTHIHRDKYSLIDNKIIFSSPVKGGLEIEVTVFDNVLSQGTATTNLSGMVVDAVLTSKNLKLLRHDAYPIILPIPAVQLSAGAGIKVTGSHPDYKIENTYAQNFNSATDFNVSTRRVQNDAEEIVFTHRIDIQQDLTVQITADFTARLGPGFVVNNGLEVMEYVIGFRTTAAKEPDYGRDIVGTGEAGFNALSGGASIIARSNASLTRIINVVKANIPAGYIDVVAKARVRNANVSLYGSKLAIDFNVIGRPKLN